MKLRSFALSIVAMSVLVACGSSDDNDDEVLALEGQVTQLQQTIDDIQNADTDDVAPVWSFASATVAKIGKLSPDPPSHV